VTDTVDVTVFIPTFNGEKYLDQLLTAVESQDFVGEVEILVIDSGSTDGTLSIIAAHEGVRLVQIPQSEFGHGRTRNLAAQLARGEVIAYLSHDAVPHSTSWLRELVAPLHPAGADAVAVFGKHVARANCSPLLAYEIEGVFRACGPDDRVTVVQAGPEGLDALPPAALFYSDVNSASRRHFLTQVIPYRDVSYSEDLAYARDLLAAGYRKAYAPAAVVEHSNDVTLAEYGPRVFDETLGQRRVGEGRPHLSGLGAVLRALKDTVVSGVRLCGDPRYSRAEKLKWSWNNPRHAWAKWLAIYRASHVSLTDEEAIARYSLEARRRRAASAK
jgi:rhamnosyltransferase